MRVDNWTMVLAESVERWRPRRFDWATWNCCTLADDHILALTGAAHHGAFPSYASQEEAEAILAEYGGMAGLITYALGPVKPVAMAMRGDIVAADFGYGLAASVCLGVQCCAPGPRGLVFRPTAIAVAAWTI